MRVGDESPLISRRVSWARRTHLVQRHARHLPQRVDRVLDGHQTVVDGLHVPPQQVRHWQLVDLVHERVARQQVAAALCKSNGEAARGGQACGCAGVTCDATRLLAPCPPTHLQDPLPA